MQRNPTTQTTLQPAKTPAWNALGVAPSASGAPTNQGQGRNEMKTRRKKPLAHDSRLHSGLISRIAGDYVMAGQEMLAATTAEGTEDWREYRGNTQEIISWLRTRAADHGKGHHKVYVPVRRGLANALKNIPLGSSELTEEEIFAFAVRCCLNDYKRRHGEILLHEVADTIHEYFTWAAHPPLVMDACAEQGEVIAEHEAEQDGLREEGREEIRFEQAEKIQIGLARMKAEGRRNGRPPADFDEEQARALRALGLSYRKIAAQLDTNYGSIGRFFRADTTDAPIQEAVPF